MTKLKIKPLIVTLGLLASTCCAANATETIKTFAVKAILQRDSTLDVRESIAMDFAKNPRHGIERIYGQHRDIAIQAVSNQNGSNVPYTVSIVADRYHLKIGSPQKTVKGLNTYNIHYQLKGAVQSSGRLDWSPTGHRWQQPINTFTMVFTSQNGPIKTLPAACIIGGNTRPKTVIENGSVQISAEKIQPGSGIDLSFEDLNGLSANILQSLSIGQSANYIPLVLICVVVLVLMFTLQNQTLSARSNCGCRCGNTCICCCSCSSNCYCIESNRVYYRSSPGYTSYGYNSYYNEPSYNWDSGYTSSSSSSDYSAGDSSSGNNDDGGGSSW